MYQDTPIASSDENSSGDNMLAKAKNALQWLPLVSSISSGGTSYTNSSTKPDPEQEEQNGLLKKQTFWNNEDLSEGITDKLNNITETAENQKYGMILMVVGGLILFMSSFYLPFIAIVPEKFCGLFSMGSIIIICALGQMIGPNKFVKIIYSKNNLPYSTAYTISLILGIYYSVIEKRYLFVLVLAIAQVFFFYLKNKIVCKFVLFIVTQFALWKENIGLYLGWSQRYDYLILQNSAQKGQTANRYCFTFLICCFFIFGKKIQIF